MPVTGDLTTLAAPARPTQSYKWIVVSNTTLGSLLATINSSVTLISMPAIFRGIYGGKATGWGNPLVAATLGFSIEVLLVFIAVELNQPEPMFRLSCCLLS